MSSTQFAKRRFARRFALGFSLLGAACAPQGSGPEVGQGSQPLVLPGAPLEEHAAARGAMASAVDERGVPNFLFAAGHEAPPEGTAPASAALFHVEHYAAALGLRPESMSTLEPYLSQDLGAGGLLTRVRQRVAGVPVYRTELRVLMRQDRSLVAMSGRLHPTTDARVAFVRPAETSLATAVTHLTGAALGSAQLQLDRQPGDDEELLRFRLADEGAGIVMPAGAVAQKVLYPQGNSLRPAWQVEFYAGRDAEASAEAWRYVMAADDGSLLERVSLTQEEAFNFRVWADATGDQRPTDTALKDFTPHPTGKLDYAYPDPADPVLVTMEGFNKNPMGGHDPWMAAGAKDTQGNNADAYSDKKSPDGIGGGDYRATVTSPNTFDRMYNFKIDPGTTTKDQVMVGITQAFYDVNWMHDYFYDSGFDEKAGNAQKDNYNRGGRGNDAMRVETQDYSGRDNANMSTPGDGLQPRMQMFLWTGKEQRVLHVTPGDFDLTSNSANFGPDKFDISGEVVEVNDQAFNTTDGCEVIKNDGSPTTGPSLEGKIALIDRGSCTFKLKSVHAQDKGAIGVIIVNNQTGGAPGMGNGAPMSTVLNIPVLSTTISGGAKIRELMLAGPVTLRLARVRDIDRDAGLDATVVTHEWGHYLHHRLADCVQHQCGAMSEGWADFNALMMVLHEGDNLDAVYPLAIYSSVAFPFPGYFGIRRYPYSTDFTKFPLTFKYIADGVVLPSLLAQSGGGPNSEVHNSGEVWANMMWEVYVALQKDGKTRSPALTFDQVRRKMADYVVAGHQMTPRDATYTETRDALLAVAQARDPRDFTVIAEAFARRGLGTCADSPPRNSQDHKGAVEAFKVQPRLVIVSSSMTPEDSACDNDGVLDAGEKATIKLTLANGAPTALSGAKINLGSNLPEVTFDGPSSFDVPALDPLKTFDITATVKVDPKMAQSAVWKLKIDGDTATNCGGAAPELPWKINYDVQKEISRTDDVEAEPGVWTPDGNGGNSIWGRAAIDPSNHAWHGNDAGIHSDTWLVSPDLKVSANTWFAMSFRHRFSFEFDSSMPPTQYFDGGVIELSEDGGMTWKDAMAYGTTPPYVAKVAEGDVALTGQLAFVGQSNNWPFFDTVNLNFTDKFAGKTIKVRFRIATDQKNGTGQFFGWDIDDITFVGIDNTPFTATTFDAGKCGVGPRGPTVTSETGCSLGGRAAGPLAPASLLLAALLGLLVRRRAGHRAA